MGSRSIRPTPPTKPIRVRADSLAPFLRRLVTMLDAGVTLASCLEFLLRSEDDPGLQKVLDYLCKGVNAGMRLSDAMRPPAFRSVFNPVVVGMIRMGEETGALAGAVGVVADLSEAQLRLRRATISALTYPLVLMVAILFAGLLFVAILGAPGGLFSMFGNDLPGPTRALVRAAALVRSPFVIFHTVMLFSVAAWLWYQALENSPAFRRSLHFFVLKLPLVGTLVRKTCIARILCVLANCLQVGVPLIQALDLARAVSINLIIEERFSEALIAVREGMPLSDAWRQSHVFPSLVTTLVRLGEESGNLDMVMGRVSRMFEEEVMETLDRALQFVEPILMTLAGLGAMFLALATLLPIIRLTQSL